MLPVLSAQQMRDFDRRATEVLGVPSLTLMETAGRGAAGVILGWLADGGVSGPCVVVAGAGNNGGDGFVVARRLLEADVAVQTFLAVPSDKLKGDAEANYRELLAVGGSIVELVEGDVAPLESALGGAGLVIDALLGTGLDREVTGFLARVIEVVNAAPCRRLSLDLPSGLHADTGRVLGVAVRADRTVTFAHPKLGLCTPLGSAHAGHVDVREIGVPGDPSATGFSAQLLEASDVIGLLRPRATTLHKSSAGRVLIAAGSPGKLGAALLSAHGAQRAGAGLVTIATSPAAADALDGRVLEAMTARIDAGDPRGAVARLLEPCDAAVVGPGLGLDERARAIVDAVVLDWPGPKVLDADGITLFASRAGELARVQNLVLTPHAGELGRLLGVPYEQVEANRFEAVARAVELTGAVVVLKGRFTIVGATEQLPLLNPTGGPVLATGGTGDVLSGIIAALSCQLTPYQAAYIGAYLHGAAADTWAGARGADRGMLAHELADLLPSTIGGLLKDSAKASAFGSAER